MTDPTFFPDSDGTAHDCLRHLIAHLWSDPDEVIIPAGWYGAMEHRRPDMSPTARFTVSDPDHVEVDITTVQAVDGPTEVLGIEMELDTGQHVWINPDYLAHAACDHAWCLWKNAQRKLQMMLNEKAAQAYPLTYGGVNRALFKVWQDDQGRVWMLDVHDDLHQKPVLVDEKDREYFRRLFGDEWMAGTNPGDTQWNG